MSLNRIVDIREENELTQEELSKIVGGSRVNISNWENDKRCPNIEKVNIIANSFNLSLDYIFRLTNQKNYSDITNQNIDKNVTGQRISQLRKKNKISLETLAKQINTTSSTISAYEKGETLLLTAFAIDICKKYKVSMDWLYGKRNNCKI